MSSQTWDDIIVAVSAGAIIGLVLGWILWAPVY